MSSSHLYDCKILLIFIIKSQSLNKPLFLHRWKNFQCLSVLKGIVTYNAHLTDTNHVSQCIYTNKEFVRRSKKVAFMQFSYSRTPGSCISHRDVEGGPCFGRKHPIRQACLGVSVMGKNQSQSYFLKPISISQLSINFADVLPICISLNFRKKVCKSKMSY